MRPGAEREGRGRGDPKAARPRAGHWDLPPDVFWISPEGEVIEVIGHLTEIMEAPERFGLAAAPSTKEEADRTFAELMEQGWVRGRLSGSTFNFHILEPRTDALAASQAFVSRYAGHGRWVVVDFWRPIKPPAPFTVRDFVEGRWPAAWARYGVNAKERRR
jgi:hypothetical protein